MSYEKISSVMNITFDISDGDKYESLWLKFAAGHVCHITDDIDIDDAHVRICDIPHDLVPRESDHLRYLIPALVTEFFNGLTLYPPMSAKRVREIVYPILWAWAIEEDKEWERRQVPRLVEALEV